MYELIVENQLFYSLLLSAFSLVAGFVVSIWLFRLIKRIFRNKKNPAFHQLASIIQYPFKLIIVLIAVSVLKTQLQIIDHIELQQFFYLLFLAAFSWLAVSIIKAIKVVVLTGYNVDNEDNLQARKIHTQVRVFERIAIFLVVFIASALALLSFDSIKEIGVSLLASAGIAGLILGFAAQKSISMLLAGFQLALTQPIRLDDVVIIEGEWGRIEEITLTYVVVAIWDKRRLIVPVNYFIEKPFQNWTRHTAEILGTVFIYVDYGFPLDKLREFMDESLKNNPFWDGKAKALQVTDCTEKTIQIRALASAKDSPSAWELRVKLREDLIEFIRNYYPAFLPKTRININKEAGTE